MKKRPSKKSKSKPKPQKSASAFIADALVVMKQQLSEFEKQHAAFSEKLAKLIAMVRADKPVVTVTISGPQGAGKSTIADVLTQMLVAARVQVRNMDVDEFDDAPARHDYDRLVECLSELSCRVNILTTQE